MSNQYPLPAGYPPPGATYGMNQQAPPAQAANQPAQYGFVSAPQQQQFQQQPMPMGPQQTQSVYMDPHGAPGAYPGMQGTGMTGPPGLAGPSGPGVQTSNPPGMPLQSPGPMQYGPADVHPNMNPSPAMMQPAPNMQTGPGLSPGYNTASYAAVNIPEAGKDGSFVLPYGNAPPVAAASQSNNNRPISNTDIDDPILLAEMNEAANLVLIDRNAQVTPKQADPRPASVVAEIKDPQPAAAAVVAEKRAFYLISESGDKVLELHKEKVGASLELGKKKTSSPGQLWYIGEDGFLRSKWNNLMLSAAGNHKELKTAESTGDARQQWLVEGNKVINKVFPDECVTIKKGPAKIKDDGVMASKYEGKSSQHWKQEFVDA